MKNVHELLENLGKFEKAIGYSFSDPDKAVLALTHSSYANEIKNKRLESNERLEFLGDAVLNISISEKIYLSQSRLPEGEMTRIRAGIVCESSLIVCSNNINLGDYILLGKGEQLTGGRTRTSILSDAFEAVIGAIYLDGGLAAAKEFIYVHMNGIIENSISGTIFQDYKTQLQEIVQKKHECGIVYEIIDENGPDHNKMFVSRVSVNEKHMGTGKGRSKKEAEQNAAKTALDKLT
ncbi:RNAse III [Anaerobacterium chartisolvens]|uniref:Ribonuclease 3 n=1 Tax=Anaerobacterium chartisolvens TaxID=1297424 RepID=A0A369BHU4_9FIRM|nr:ribonuclease III [Anaerobacterium chartisolvens]RCX20027.1 RNAse III [Anaerobacterium chartisolvens]